jgi:hypothetical protein
LGMRRAWPESKAGEENFTLKLHSISLFPLLS